MVYPIFLDLSTRNEGEIMNIFLKTDIMELRTISIIHVRF